MKRSQKSSDEKDYSVLGFLFVSLSAIPPMLMLMYLSKTTSLETQKEKFPCQK